METRPLILILLSFTLLAFNNQSSLSPSQGDKNTAPIVEEHESEIPGDKVLPPKLGTNLDEIIQKARAAMEEEKKKVVESNSSVEAPPTEVKEAQTDQASPNPRPAVRQPRILPQRIEPVPQPVFSYFSPGGESVTVFPSNARRKQQEETITLPSGAHAFGRTKFGEEVTASGQREVSVEIDYAFLGPNESVVEMVGCVVWFGVNSDFHSQKVRGQAKDLTCVGDQGRVFTVAVDGVLVGAANEYGGVESNLIMRGPAMTAAFKFLGDITSAYGSALSAMETTTSSIRKSEDRDDTIKNVTGDKATFSRGKVVEANGEFLKYISSFFQSMEPTLALAPGTKIHFVNRYNIQIPKEFFKTKSEKKK